MEPLSVEIIQLFPLRYGGLGFPPPHITCDAGCGLPSVRDGSTFLPESNPRMNSPRRSRVAGVPSVFLTPFGVPLAGDQPEGHDVPTNAITQPVGTTAASFASMIAKFDTILFHSDELTWSPDPTVATVARLVNAAYATDTAATVVAKAKPANAPFTRESVFVAAMLVFYAIKERDVAGANGERIVVASSCLLARRAIVIRVVVEGRVCGFESFHGIPHAAFDIPC